MALNYHFDTETFLAMWNEWKDFRKKILKKPIKDEQRALNLINRLSFGNEQIAYQIIQRSIDNEYQGLFPLPINYQNNTTASMGKIAQLQSSSIGADKIIEKMYGQGNQ